MRHLPYRVTAQLVTDLMTGIVPLSFQNIANVLGQVQSGDLRPLAIAAKSRSPTLPEVPTAAEAGLPGFESAAWFALLAPRGTPKANRGQAQRCGGRRLAGCGAAQASHRHRRGPRLHRRPTSCVPSSRPRSSSGGTSLPAARCRPSRRARQVRWSSGRGDRRNAAVALLRPTCPAPSLTSHRRRVVSKSYCRRYTCRSGGRRSHWSSDPPHRQR